MDASVAAAGVLAGQAQDESLDGAAGGVEGGGVLARRAPHDLLGVMVGDQGQVVVVAFPADLVDPDADQPVESGGVEPVGDHPRADPPNTVPVQPGEPGDRGLVGLGRQGGHQVLEVAGEPRAVPGEGHRLHPHPVGRAAQPAQPGTQLHPPAPEVQIEGPSILRTANPLG